MKPGDIIEYKGQQYQVVQVKGEYVAIMADSYTCPIPITVKRSEVTLIS